MGSFFLAVYVGNRKFLRRESDKSSCRLARKRKSSRCSRFCVGVIEGHAGIGRKAGSLLLFVWAKQCCRSFEESPHAGVCVDPPRPFPSQKYLTHCGIDGGPWHGHNWLKST